ncbi:glycosyltransferase [Neobacillus sp. DY30]|uniref:glycosyltransferase family 2 protein n=1 Tax=Neobacillus sp. DY30 TaxID=3047871 RepID=UPI0024BF6326|nr:glycosyltransferase [Neobacillus sp. DY30]WHY00416.1 glycosyltransferase [Neobacillus sp. DY30]
MLFSIVVPMYNSEKYIGNCIESVLKQTEGDFQLIIVNDGSNDDCGDIADNYAATDKRIMVIHQENSGSFHARIKGVDNALGDYVVFLDADDTLKEYTLEQLKKHILIDEPDIIIYRAENFIENGGVFQSEKLFKDGTIFEDSNKKIVYEKFITDSSLNNLWTKAIKTKCFDNNKVRHYPPISMGDDVLFTLEPLTNAKKIKYIDEILYNYRIIKTSMTRKFQPNVYNGFKLITIAKKGYLSKWDMNTEKYINELSIRTLKNVSGIALYSQANIRGREKEFVNVLKEIQSDSFFYEAYSTSFRSLSLLRKLPIFLIMKNKLKLLSYLKLIVTKLRTIKQAN